MMADFIVREGIQEARGLKKFKTAGYKYSARESDGSKLVFLRKEQG